MPLFSRVDMTESALDFPQIWQQPSWSELLDCLRRLEVKPPVWDYRKETAEIVEDYREGENARRQIAAYLTSIIKSSLGWIEDGDERDIVWEAAGRRISERSGRAGE